VSALDRTHLTDTHSRRQQQGLAAEPVASPL
jgi:hypothetical protein